MNHCSFIGNFTRDPDRVSTQTGKVLAKFSLAIRYNKDNTDFFDFVAWDSVAEFILEHFSKGEKIAVECNARQDKWKTTEGENRSKVVFHVSKAHFCGNAKKENKEETETEVEEVPTDTPF